MFGQVLVEKPAKTAAKAISAANAFAEAGKKAAPAPSNFAESVRRVSPQPSRAERNSPLLLTIGTAGTNTSLRFFAHDCWSDAFLFRVQGRRRGKR